MKPTYYIEYFHSWYNGFLTVEGFATYYGFGYKEAIHIINKGRILHESQFGSILENDVYNW